MENKHTTETETSLRTSGPGNLNFVRQLPAAQEPRASVLMHTDGSVKFSTDAATTWPTTTFHPTVSSSSAITRSRIKSVERTPRSASAFSSASSASPTNSMANGNVGVRLFANNNKTTERPQSLLGSLLAATSTSRRSPSVPESRTERQSGLIERRTQDQESIKSCMSTLAVNLSNAPTSAASSTTSTGGHPSSGRSDNDSMGSPHSTRSTSDSARSHNSRPPSPGHAHDGASTGGGSMASNGDVGDETSRERYMDRRRRNNEAAKRCRANRRAVFEYRSRRAQQLEAENSDLRQEMLKLNNELEQLKAVIAANSRLLAA
ncbi:hypothetical protein M3Y95_01146700 [Aphelenchoides besseyi]|nr:hypothetical protein M3Y95_01146700 [Aphelenchoides besseyi]